MRRWNWLSFAVVCAGVVVSASSLTAQQSNEAKTKEGKVRKAVLTRFDENRNDKLDAGEAKQARARLRNLLEDKSSREINIMTWRDDVHDLLRDFDQDGDNRLTPEERDAGVRLLERIIPKVDTEKSDAAWSAPSLPTSSKSKSGGSGFTEAQRNQRVRSGSGRGGVYSIGMGSGGFGNGMGYTVGAYGAPFSGYGNSFAGVGIMSNGSLNSGSFGSSSSLMGGTSGSSKTGSDIMSGSANGIGIGSAPTSGSSGFQQGTAPSSFGLGPLTDNASRGGFPGAGPNSGALPGSSAASGPGSMQPGSTPPDGLAAPGMGLTRPTGSGLSGPTQIPPNPKPNF